MAGWKKRWPKKPGLYWFYGYPTNKDIDVFPRLLLVNVEYYGEMGTRARSFRTVLNAATLCDGYWKEILVPDLPEGEQLNTLLTGRKRRKR